MLDELWQSIYEIGCARRKQKINDWLSLLWELDQIVNVRNLIEIQLKKDNNNNG